MQFITTHLYQTLFSLAVTLLLSIGLLTPSNSRADDLLSRIAQTRTIALSYQTDAFPFSYVEDNKPRGFSIEICNRLVDILKQELNIPALKIHWVPVTTATQFLTIENKTIDLGCIPTIYTPERQKVVTFSEPYFFSATRYVSRKEDRISDINELNGHTVMVKSGTVFVRHIQQANSEHQLSLNIDLGTDNVKAFSDLESGQTPAIVSSDILLLGQIALSGHPQAFAISADTLSPRLPIGMPMQIDNGDFTNVINHSMKRLMLSKEFTNIYNKWFFESIMPQGITLNWPMPPELKQSLSSTELYSYSHEPHSDDNGQP
ncbi:amino acid ABC transporter substrate-binding protein [Buttiauxella massiliensis]|uniref:amino acid ABC transporter substrate-binding protein n=1 Tax=Buttiauxella massiliensis TaxID=2831590 RepID=UPI00125EAFCD|nr:amino acid ABC transporter substrate-binding protein [Buttiauxella massiliensis]